MSDPLALDLGTPFREALIANTAITALLSPYEGEYAIFTRRPVPDSAGYPMIIVNDAASISDQDALKTLRPVVRLDLIAYGRQPDDYREVQAIGFLMRAQFHRQKFSITIPHSDPSDPGQAYGVVDIIVHGPMIAPADDPQHVARACALTVRLQDLST